MRILNPLFILTWVSSHSLAEEYALPVSVTGSPGANTPIIATIDFGAMDGIAPFGLTRNSFRVSEGTFDLPCHLNADFETTGIARVAWRSTGAEQTEYTIYFGSQTRGHSGLIGIGDTFHYQSGATAPANIFPLHSQFLHLDWDNDGRRDLLGWSFRTWEYGETLEPRMGNAVYFLRNLGNTTKPVLSKRRRIRDSEGQFLRSDLLPQNWFSDDVDGDGDPDFYGLGPAFWLTHWENTGMRDERGLWRLKPGKQVVQLREESEFRKATPGILRKTNSWAPRGVRRVDWEGDGDVDLIVGYRKVSRLRTVDTSRGVAPYGTAVMVFDLWENTGNDEEGTPVYASPVTLTDLNKFPISTRGHANGCVEYVDWDNDGDFDLLYHSETDRPLEGGRLMFSENRGTRSNPLFEASIPLDVSLVDSPFLVDWNSDGLIDMISCGEFFENVNPRSRVSFSLPGAERYEPARGQTDAGTRLPKIERYPKLVSRGFAEEENPEIINYFTVSVDWDKDGDLDLVGGYHSGIRLFLNKGTTLEPVFEQPVMLQAGNREISMPNYLDPQRDEPSTFGPQGPTEPEYGWLLPTIGDWDGDGDLDLFVTAQRWETKYFENTGTREAPRFAEGRTVTINGLSDEIAWRSKISVGDLDGDGTMDLVMHSDRDNGFYICARKERQPDPGRLDFSKGPALQLESGKPVTGWFDGQNNNGDNHTLLTDWDGDGDLDLIKGTLWAIYYYENTGTPEKPIFAARGKFRQGDDELQVYNHACSFDAADWTGDGSPDLVLGTEAPSDSPHGGVLHLFERNFLEGRIPTVRVGELHRIDP